MEKVYEKLSELAEIVIIFHQYEVRARLEVNSILAFWGNKLTVKRMK